MKKLLAKFWHLFVFLATMAVVGVICLVAFTFTKGKVDEELHRQELVPTKAQVTRRLMKKDKKDNSKTATWVEVKLQNGRLHEIEGDLGVAGDVIEVKVPRYLVADEKELSDVEKEKLKEKQREERKKNR